LFLSDGASTLNIIPALPIDEGQVEDRFMEIESSSSALSSAKAQSSLGVTLLRKGMDYEKEQVSTLLEGMSGVDPNRPRGDQVRLEA
jgi:hypothetical protein